MRVLRVFHSGPVAAWRDRERALRARGHDVRLVSACRWNEGGHDVTLRPALGEDVVGARTIGRHPALFVYDPRPLWRALGEEWDVLDIHEEPFALATAEVRLLAWLRGRRRTPITLYSAQNIDKRYPVPFRWLERSALRAAAGVSVCNAAAGDILRRKGLRTPARVIPLGIDPGRFAPDPAVAVRRGAIGYVGRLETHKGVADLVDAVAGAPELTLEIAGAGPEEDALRRRAEAAGTRIRFLGPLDQDALPDFYRSIDVLAVPSVDTPSWREQFGRVVVEAQASGTPVVVSDGGALPEVVGDAGVVVPQRDVAALRRALVDLVTDRPRRERLAAAGPVAAAACSWERVADAYEQLYAAARPAMRPDRGVEVVVVAYGSPALLAAALEPVRHLPITVVDNSSLPQIADLCDRLGARYLDPGRNLGFAGGVNRALGDRLVPGADVLLLNPDAVVSADTVAALHDRLRSSPDVAAVAPAQVDGSGNRARVAWPFPTPARAWLEAAGLGRFLPGEYLIGSVLLLADDAIAGVGMFDDATFFLYAEETDWQRRAADLGWRTAYQPDLHATHVGGATSTDPRRRELLFHGAQERYFRKHHGALGWQVARAARFAGAGVRALARRDERAAHARAEAALYLRGPLRVLAHEATS